MDQEVNTPQPQPQQETTLRDYEKPAVVQLGSLAEITWNFSVEAEDWTW